MCGITGLVSFKGPVSPSFVRGMCDAIRHRGPDDEGYLAYDPASGEAQSLFGRDSACPGPSVDEAKAARAIVGFRRLSILDTSIAGHQPMSSADGRLWLVFNGEVYNYLELAEELRGLGYEFKTRADSEVVLAAYDAWGEDCLRRFNGMWSFAIVDTRRNLLWGARDRFGVKPFHYYHGQGVFAFCSEIKGLFALPFVERRLNGAAAFSYLARGRGEESLVRGIEELPPSTAFTLDLDSGAFATRRYYELGFDGTSPSGHVCRAGWTPPPSYAQSTSCSGAAG
jgi:asparagine synthase (glutamine-hydrolysing)